jgi:PAS domain S-box-containing protein
MSQDHHKENALNNNSADRRHDIPLRWTVRYGTAVVAVAAGLGLRLALTAWVGPGLATYITFYPAVMVVALMTGFGPGLLTTALTNLVVEYLINKPGEHLPGVDLLGQIIFASMGVMISIVAEYYLRIRTRAAASRSLEQERDILQSVMNGARNSHLVYLDREFNFVRVNETYAQSCGYRSEQMIGKNHFALYPDAENEAIFIRVRDTGEQASYHDKPFEFPDQPDRGLTYWDWTLTPVKASTGQVTGLVFSLFETTDRKRAEQSLRENEERLHHANELLEAVTLGSHVLIATVDMDLRYTFFNREHHSELKQLTGKDTELGMSLMDVLADIPEERDKAIPLWNRALKGETIDQTLVFGVPDGYHRWYKTRHTPIRDTGGEIIGAGEVTTDITELMNVQEALRESEKKYRRLFHNMAEGFALYEMLYDADGKAADWRILEINDAYTRHTSVTSEMIIGRRISEIFPEIFFEYLPIFKVVVSTQTPHEFETYVKHTGRYLHVVTFPVSGNLFANIIEDFTERKQAQEALQRSEAHFKLLSQTAEQLIMWKDIQAVVNDLCKKAMEHLDCQVFFNYLIDQKAGRLHLNAFAGIPDDEARKIDWLDFGAAVCGCAAIEEIPIIIDNILTTPDPRTELVKSYGIQAYACHPLIVRGEVIGTLSFGTKTRMSFSEEDLVLMRRIAAQVAMAMERARLIDQLKKSRDELEIKVQERTADLKKMNEELRRSNMALEDFAHVASHDLQEPLRKIMTFSERLATIKDDYLSDQTHDYLARMKHAANRMHLLIQDLVKYSRVTSSPEHFRVMNLRESVDDAVKDLSVLIDETEGQIEIDELPDVKANRIQMSQLFVNLINNALKYRSKLKPLIRIYSNPSTDELFHEIHIEDNGIGFDEIYLDRIFKPFQRLHGKNSPYQGTGMGLTICSRIVEYHGGSITAKSEPGRGSSFIVRLPKVHDAQAGQ